MTDGSITSLDTVDLGVIAPSHDGFVSGDRVLIEEEVGRDPGVGVKAEIIPIFQIVADKLPFTRVDNWVDVVEIESELTVAI